MKKQWREQKKSSKKNKLQHKNSIKKRHIIFQSVSLRCALASLYKISKVMHFKIGGTCRECGLYCNQPTQIGNGINFAMFFFHSFFSKKNRFSTFIISSFAFAIVAFSIFSQFQCKFHSFHLFCTGNYSWANALVI